MPVSTKLPLPQPSFHEVRELLNQALLTYNRVTFIAEDPLCIPHRFENKADIEIMGFLAAVFAWGQRRTVIQKLEVLIQAFDYQPHLFIQEHQPPDLAALQQFAHRTFNYTDLAWFLNRLQYIYRYLGGLEAGIAQAVRPTDPTIERGLCNLHRLFFEPTEAPGRTRKHLATPASGSACKRLNMYLRWMVRPAEEGIDFGLWRTIRPNQLVCPLDVHSGRTARALGLLTRKANDWRAALELTENLKKLDAYDPVKYDLALFSLSHAKFVQESFSTKNHSH